MAGTAEAGERKAWDMMGTLTIKDVCRAASARYDADSERYTLRSFGRDIFVSSKDRTIAGDARDSGVLLGTPGDLFRVSVLWYLANAKDVEATSRLVKHQHPDIRAGNRPYTLVRV